jgi:hypothetical protein
MKTSVAIISIFLLGITGLLGQSSTELSLAFTSIDSLEYQNFKKGYSSQLVQDPTKKAIGSSFFTLTIDNTPQNFECEKDFSDCHYYKGFIAPLNSYVITHCGMYNCETFLVNKSSGKRHPLNSPFDNECKSPVLSQNFNKMLVFASDVFSGSSYISIYERDSHGNFDFESYASLITNKWKIFEVVWINDTTFALMTFEEYGGISGNEPLNVTFLKGEIKTNSVIR